jgi:hypothetical protein
MTIEGIIRMAKQAGFADEEVDTCQQILIHFATLVAEQEREECAGLAERRMLRDNNEDQKIGHHHACKSIAKDIRARGQA